jgi:hypothetical protein
MDVEIRQLYITKLNPNSIRNAIMNCKEDRQVDR